MSAFVTDTGLFDLIWAFTVGDGDNASPDVFFYPRYIQFGTGSGQSVTATALVSPVQSPVQAVISEETTNVSRDTARFQATVTADVDRVITEACVTWDAAGEVGMEVYGDFDAISLAAGDAIVFQFNVVATRA